jgi:hypothetical protein
VQADHPARAIRELSWKPQEDIEAAAAKGIAVYAPVHKAKKAGQDPHRPRPGDAPYVSKWRTRMGDVEAKDIHEPGAATAETVNAGLRCFRGLDRFRERPLPKVTGVVLWSVLVCDMVRLFTRTS